MRFRTQILLAFVPMFVLLGAAGETVRALLENRELHWALEEEVSSLAVSIAEFLRDQPMTAPGAGGPPVSPGRNWEQSLDDIIRHSQARRIWAFGPDGRQVIQGWAAAPVDQSPHAIPAACQTRLATNPWAMEPMSTRGGETTVTAYARLHTAEGNNVGYLAVEIGAESYLNALAQEKRKIVTGTVVSLLAGLIAMGLLVAPVTSGIRDLCAAADRAREGHPLGQPGSRFIREIDELGETFSTMGTLQNEAMDKARRILVENEQLRAPADLAASFRARFSPPPLVDFSSVEVAARLAGAAPGGAFAGCRQIQNTVWAFVGRITVSDELQQAMSSSAAQFLLEDALTRLRPQAAFAEVAGFLPLADWECVGWPLDGGTPLRWTGRSGFSLMSAVPLANATHACCLHTFGRAHQHMVDACLEGFSDLTAAEIADRILELKEADATGAFVILRRKPHPPQA